MKKAVTEDRTLCTSDFSYSFKEKLEIARLLSKLRIDVIELPEIADENTDILLVKTIASFVKEPVLSLAAGTDERSIDHAALALSTAERGRIRLELPVSPVLMEYAAKKKPKAMMEWIGRATALAKSKGFPVEVDFLDASRAEKDFLREAVRTAEENGASEIALFDDTGEVLPGEFSAFVSSAVRESALPVSVCCSDAKGLALASVLTALQDKASGVKTGILAGITDTEALLSFIHDSGIRSGLSMSALTTELHQTVRQIRRIRGSENQNTALPAASATDDLKIELESREDREVVLTAVRKLGYDLSEEDADRVYEAFLSAAEKKKVGARELDAIVASTALQVPPTYVLESYVINNGNIIPSSAQIALRKGSGLVRGIQIGDGPVDASFRAIEQITGHHYEVDDFQIQAVTEGKEALGQAFIKLRDGARVYSATGISTDIVGAGIRAYIGALNKIAYEEEN